MAATQLGAATGLSIPQRPTTTSLDQPQGMILSSALQPIPARLVRRIVAGEFVEMRDLLTDNVALHDQLEAVQGPLLTPSTPGALRARLREVPSLISWVYCFTAYIKVRTQDETTRDMLSYCRLIIREALRHGGQGWQDYDRSFRSQAAIDRSLRWNVLLPDLQASTILGQRAGGGSYCSLCRGVDHSAAQCALAIIQQPLISPQPPPVASVPSSSSRRLVPPSGRTSRPVCTSWNSGACIYPGSCSYRHVCATCNLRHRAKDCQETPEHSPYKRSTRAPVVPTLAATTGR